MNVNEPTDSSSDQQRELSSNPGARSNSPNALEFGGLSHESKTEGRHLRANDLERSTRQASDVNVLRKARSRHIELPKVSCIVIERHEWLKSIAVPGRKGLRIGTVGPALSDDPASNLTYHSRERGRGMLARVVPCRARKPRGRCHVVNRGAVLGRWSLPYALVFVQINTFRILVGIGMLSPMIYRFARALDEFVRIIPLITNELHRGRPSLTQLKCREGAGLLLHIIPGDRGLSIHGHGSRTLSSTDNNGREREDDDRWEERLR